MHYSVCHNPPHRWVSSFVYVFAQEMSLSAMETPVWAFMYENGRGGTSLGWASRMPSEATKR